MNLEIRPLRPDEIEIRVQQVKEKFAKLLLYKDARCDMRILDETFGVDGWQREHQLINGNLFCTVSIWSDRLKQWVSKQDLGTESNAEAEKGQASDSFKRACFNLGIGRELYTPIDIKIWANNTDIQSNGKDGYKLGYKEKFHVSKIGIENGKIINLEISNQDNKVVFTHVENVKQTSKKENPVKQERKINNSEAALLTILAVQKGYTIDQVFKGYKHSKLSDMTESEYQKATAGLNNKPDKEV